ncbi:MAG: RNA-binding protein, partial [Thermoprotei archaeon]
PDESFAVRTTRRGRHSFTSIDVNVAVGAAIREVTGARVDLTEPDKIVYVEIVQDKAFISIVRGSEVPKKMRRCKYPMYKLFWRMRVAHEPYVGPLDAARTMGTRIGREAQTFEIGELVVTPIGPVDARQLAEFLLGLFEGIESRYGIQVKSYGRKVHKTVVKVQDMYQFVRMHANEPLIVFEPEGEPISKVADEVRSLLLNAVKRNKKINLMVGAREGVPVGIFRFADIVLDVAPSIVISTDYALASALIALTTAIHEDLAREEER